MRVNTQFRTNDKAKWAAQTIQRILRNEVYIGTMTQGRRTTPSYKVKKMIEKPEEEWDRVENTHEAIIHKDIFDVVQMLLLRDTRISPDADRLYLFGGYLCCADCGSNMVRRRQNITTLYMPTTLVQVTNANPDVLLISSVSICCMMPF